MNLIGEKLNDFINICIGGKMGESINKIWGKRERILLTSQTEIDLLTLNKNTFCSTHHHLKKINKFIVISGKIKIETSLGNVTLVNKQFWTVLPGLKHRFVALEDTSMIECAYVEKGKINPNDITRQSLGGKIIKGKEYTIDDLKEKGMLEL